MTIQIKMNTIDARNIKVIRGHMDVLDDVISDRSDEMEYARIHARNIRVQLALSLSAILKEVEER